MWRAIYTRPLYPVVALISVVAGLYLLLAFCGAPLVLLLAILVLLAGALLAVTGHKGAYLMLFFLLPLSIETPIGIGDSKIILPSEGIEIILAITLACTVLFTKSFSRSFLLHPISVCVYMYTGSLVVAACRSQMPVVSIKYTLVQVLYLLIFYFLANLYFRGNTRNMVRTYFAYGISSLAVVLYTLVNQYGFNFVKSSSAYLMQPFYSDHAIYSACLAMLLPPCIYMAFRASDLNISPARKAIAFVMLAVLGTGVYFSYSRAGWISLAAAGIFYVLLVIIRLKPAYLFLCAVLALSVMVADRNQILDSWRQNKNNSTKLDPSLAEETGSVTNISNDVSNAERLNRWSCALRMFYDKPVTGFGPGTYQFQYLSYQRSSETTRISVFSPYHNPQGKGGSAHSEYLLALSESGIFGFAGLAGVILLSLFYGMQAYYRARERSQKVVLAIALLSMLTYAVHVVFNNYLNIDKAASLFWLSISILATISSNQKTLKMTKYGLWNDQE